MQLAVSSACTMHARESPKVTSTASATPVNVTGSV